jgi:hypothetical protein
MIKPAAVTLALVVIYGGITLVKDSRRTDTFFCSECGSERGDSSYLLVGTFSSTVKASEFTTLVKAVDPGPCPHRWIAGRHTFAASRTLEF